jgi:glutathione S-transferase
MKLYYCTGTCSLAPHIALLEAGLKFDSEAVDLRTKKTKSGEDYLKINPKGYVPALRLPDGKMLTEVAAILQWISDQVPEKNLLPAWGTSDRYSAIESLNYIATEVHKGFGQLFNKALPTEAAQIIGERLNLRLSFLENQIKDRKFFMGDQFTLVDAYLQTVLCWAPYVNIDLKPYPKLMGLIETVKARPSVQAAIAAEKN